MQSTEPTSSSGARSSVLVAVAATLFFAATGARDVVWGDPTKLVLLVEAFHLDLAQWSHAGSLVLAWPFTQLPWPELYTHRLHLASAVQSGVALGLVHGVLARLGIGPGARGVALVAVALSHTLWAVSAVHESYPAVLLVLALAVWLLVRGHDFATGLVLGVGALVHPIVLFSVPALGWMRFGAGPGAGWGAWMRGGLGLALGWLAPALLISGGDDQAAEMEWGTVLERYAGLDRPLRNLPVLAGLAVYNFAGPALVLLVLGVRRMSVRARWSALLLLLVHGAVAAFWMLQRAYLITLPVYLAAAWPLALGAEEVLARGRIGLRVLLAGVLAAPVLAYALAPPLYDALPLGSVIRDAPLRDESAYFLRPWKCDDDSARCFIVAVDAAAPEDALLVGDFIVLGPLQYAQRLEGWRADLELVSIDHVEPAVVDGWISTAREAGRAVLLLDDEPEFRLDELGARGRLVPVPGLEAVHRLER